MLTPMKTILTKLDAAHRQLATAICMYFDDADPVAIHTLACAAREIYEKNCKKAGIDRMFNHIQETHRQATEKELWDILNGARNFFKHPGESLDETIELRDRDNKHMLFVACHDCAILCKAEQPAEVQVFTTWFMAIEFPSEDKESPLEILELLDRSFPGIRGISASEQKQWGRKLLAEFRTFSRVRERLGYSN